MYLREKYNLNHRVYRLSNINIYHTAILIEYKIHLIIFDTQLKNENKLLLQ